MTEQQTAHLIGAVFADMPADFANVAGRLAATVILESDAERGATVEDALFGAGFDFVIVAHTRDLRADTPFLAEVVWGAGDDFRTSRWMQWNGRRYIRVEEVAA